MAVVMPFPECSSLIRVIHRMARNSVLYTIQRDCCHTVSQKKLTTTTTLCRAPFNGPSWTAKEKSSAMTYRPLLIKIVTVLIAFKIFSTFSASRAGRFSSSKNTSLMTDRLLLLPLPLAAFGFVLSTVSSSLWSSVFWFDPNREIHNGCLSVCLSACRLVGLEAFLSVRMDAD